MSQCRKKLEMSLLDPYIFQDVRLFLFFCFAQGSEISSVLNLPQVVEQMN